MDKKQFEKEFREQLEEAELATTGMGGEGREPIIYADDIIDFHESTFDDFIYEITENIKKEKHIDFIGIQVGDYSINEIKEMIIKSIKDS